MKQFLLSFRPLAADFLSTIVFVTVYVATANVKLGILLGILSGIGQFGWLLLRGRSIALMQWMSLVLVIVLGGASLFTADPRFVMIKPSIGAGAIGCVMLKRGWQSRYLPTIVVEHVSPAVLVLWGYAWAGLLFVLAAANLVVAFFLGLKVWVWFTTVVPVASQLLLFMAQFLSIRFIVRRRLSVRAMQAGEPSTISQSS